MAPRILILLIALAAPSTSVGAGPPSAFPKSKKPPKVLPYRAVGTWGVSPRGRRVNVTWQCDPFVLEADGDHAADVRMSLLAQRGSGPVSTRVLQNTDATNLDGHRTTARVSASVNGNGVAFFNLALEIEGEDHPAGAYSSTVNVTVSSN